MQYQKNFGIQMAVNYLLWKIRKEAEKPKSGMVDLF